MDLTKLETGGDLAHHTPFAVPKKVKWITDRYGFRKKDAEGTRPQVVIIGDSNIAGSRLTQEEMVSEVLESELDISVYPYAPTGFNSFLKDLRFKKVPPRVVIVSVIERDILNLPFPKLRKKRESLLFLYEWKNQIKEAGWVQSVGVLLDRLFKMNMLRYARAKMGNRVVREAYQFPSKFGPMYFLEGERANREVPDDQFERAIKTLETYNGVVRERGIRFIFAPIPNKETIFYECLGTRRPIFLKQLVARLKELNVETVDTQTAFEQAFQKGILLYQKDDTHWNAEGVRIVADLLRHLIEKGRSARPLGARNRSD
jgi:hypothetical protein